MDDDHRELVRRLFASATELIETAHDAAVAGQSGEIAAGAHAEAARRLQAWARDIAVGVFSFTYGKSSGHASIPVADLACRERTFSIIGLHD